MAKDLLDLLHTLRLLCGWLAKYQIKSTMRSEILLKWKVWAVQLAVYLSEGEAESKATPVML